MLKIYGRANSINVRKVLWICGEIGLPFERLDYGRGYQATDTPEFLKVSRFGVVPVIDDDGFVLRESNTIVRYLADRHEREDLYPAALQARAKLVDNGAHDLAVRQKGDDHCCVGDGGCNITGRVQPCIGEALAGFSRQIETDDVEAGPGEAGRHRKSHVAEADNCKARGRTNNGSRQLFSPGVP